MLASKDLTITGPSGEKMSAFFAGPEARERFQQLEMYDENDRTVAMPYLRSHARIHCSNGKSCVPDHVPHLRLFVGIR